MKLVLLGAGIRTPLLIHGLVARQEALGLGEVCLFDTDPHRLETMAWLGAHIARERGATFRVTQSPDVRTAVVDAAFIFSSIRVGQEQGRVIDEQIALDHGVIGQETTGPGGFAMALRTIPVLLDYARVIEEVAPTAWFVNFTNPAGLITQALTSHTSLRVVGICDTPTAMRSSIATFLDREFHDVFVDYVGLNHLGWVRRILIDDIDVLSDVIDRYRDLQKVGHAWSLFDAKLVKSLGMLPNEYLYYFYYRDLALSNIVESGSTRGRQIREINVPLWDELEDLHAANEKDSALQGYLCAMTARSGSYMARESGTPAHVAEPADWRTSTFFDDEGYAGLALDVMQAITQDKRSILILNVRNGSTIAELEPDDVIETVCMVDRHGSTPFAQPPLPQSIRGLVESIKQYERQAVRAAVHGDRDAGVSALAGHPLVMSWSLAESIMSHILEAHRNVLPQFA